MKYFLGRVIKTHPHDNSLDIELVYDRSRLTAVPLLSPSMTTSSGHVDIHSPEGNEFGQKGSSTRDCYVAVAQTESGFIALGFIAPPVNQMAFDRPNFRVDRHASDVYQTIDKDGNIEIAHPSGTFVRIATTAAHEDLTGQDFDKIWDVTRNKTRQVWLSLQIANSGGVKATLTIDPSGNVTLTHAGNLTVGTAGDATLTAATMTINAPTTINGATAINGDSLTHNGISVGDTHKHSGVVAGPSSTGNPV